MSRKEVIDKTLGEIRTFLDEISNGTSHYRSLHNLTEQVEHQYHGRFLIELIQNAHDALFEAEKTQTSQHIEIVLAEDEYPYGALYIANGGQPFTSSNFKALSNLGQSDKDPQKCIGNKGIGFRSVLEITKEPEIYSRKEKGGSSFDGYCFRFSPDVIRLFEGSIGRVVEGENEVEPPEGFEGQLLEWDDARYETLRQRCRSSHEVRKKLDYLSPYALPIPLDSRQANNIVEDFEQRGLSTVVRLPFFDESGIDVASEKLEEINETTIIFLRRVNILRIINKGVERIYTRKQIARTDDPEEGFEVQIIGRLSKSEAAEDCSQTYWLWQRSVGGENNPSERDEINRAVAKLPGKWPELDEATVEIAVQVGGQPRDGLLNIYLPTRIPSGCVAQFNAPFYGDMSRTDVDFDQPFNAMLLEAIAEKGVNVIQKCLSGKGEAEAAAIIDILAPSDDEQGRRWWNALDQVFKEKDIDIKELEIAKSDMGWRSFACAKLLPKLESDFVVNVSLLRSEAKHPVFVSSLQEREAWLRRIFEKIGISCEAMPEQNAVTVEAIAKKLNVSEGPVDWSGFWKDVDSLFDGDAKPLIGKEVLLGIDNQLHSCSDECSVFFRPRGSSSDDEVLTDAGIEDIPENLRRFVAFLSKDIQTHEPRAGGGVETTAVHSYLSKELVQEYRVEKIFSGVLVKAVPKLPHSINGTKSQLCRDIIQWGLRLLQGSKHSMDEPIRLLGKLPAPCVGGWYPINETSFGPGWPGKSGENLKAYLCSTETADTAECKAALERLLFSPAHQLWGDVGSSSVDILEKAGAFNGIRLMPVDDKAWNAQFVVSRCRGVNLPSEGPPSFCANVWEAYRKRIKNDVDAHYQGEFDYEMENVFSLPGFEKLEDFNESTHKLLMELLLTSIPSWGMKWEWEKSDMRKLKGEWDVRKLNSPLRFALMEMNWLQGEIDEKTIQFRPSDRWHIPSSVLGAMHQFSHLMPMPASIKSKLDENPEITESMLKLGMPIYDPDPKNKTTDSRLLDDLAEALESPKIDISNQSVFLGQVRIAWSKFDPGEEGKFPKKVIVHQGSGSLMVVTPSEDDSVYLPDATPAIRKGLESHSKLVVAMHESDAKRLRENFQKEYGEGVRSASELKINALVDGKRWKARDNRLSLAQESPWLILIVLSVFAFFKGRSGGVQTKTFAKAMDDLRGAQIDRVDGLEVGLSYEDEGRELARAPVPALWLQEANTLLVETESNESKLGEALASMVDRSDIDIPLKFVLSKLESESEKSDDVVCSCLEDLDITADHFQEVRHQWFGELEHKIKLVKPLILLMQPDADLASLDDVKSEDQFSEILGSYVFDPLDPAKVLSIVEQGNSLKSVGHEVWKILGDQAELCQWNKVLDQSGESRVRNEHAEEQFRDHMESCGAIFRSIVRHKIKTHTQSKKGFKSLEGELRDIKCPQDYAEKYWHVGFPEVMQEVCNVLMQWEMSTDVVAAMKSAKSAEDLRDELDALDLWSNIDPVETDAANRQIFSRIFEDVKKVALAWCRQENIKMEVWQRDCAYIEQELLVEDFKKTAFIETWDEAKCFELLGKLNQSFDHAKFWTALSKSSNVSELRSKLGVSEDGLTDVREQLIEDKEREKLKEKTHEVCGKKFVNDKENLNDLYDHIRSATEDGDVAVVDLTNFEKLEDQAEPPKPPRGPHTSGVGQSKRMSQEDKDLIGLAGEIHAFLNLQKYYGVEIVGPSNWISSNSLYKYPNNNVHDGKGCDFQIHKDGKTHYFEVKATQSEDAFFEFGSSEIKLAIECADRQNKKFVILHVLKALSKSPQLRLLPNPYDRKQKGKYTFEESGLRVRYTTSG